MKIKKVGTMTQITKNHAILSDIDLSLLPSTSTDIEKWQQDLVRDLEDLLGGALCMITGRGIDSVDKVFPGVAASVEQHAAWRSERGEELAMLGQQMDVNEIVQEAANELSGKVKIIQSIADIANTESGVYIEEKQFSIALIFTDAASCAIAEEAARKIMEAKEELRDTHGVKVGSDAVEIGPQGVDKGKAVHDFMATAKFAGRTPIYIGDGPTDEDAMRVCKLYGGFNIAVGNLIEDESIVDLRVDTIEEVWDVLQEYHTKLSMM